MKEMMLLEEILGEDLNKKAVIHAKYVCEGSSSEEFVNLLKENFTLENLSLDQLKSLSIMLETYATIIETRNIYSFLSENIDPSYNMYVEDCRMSESDPQGGIGSWLKSLPQKAVAGVQRQSWLPGTQASKVSGSNKAVTQAQSEVTKLQQQLQVARGNLKQAQGTAQKQTQKHQVNLPGSANFRGQGPSFKQGALRTMAKPLVKAGQVGASMMGVANKPVPGTSPTPVPAGAGTPPPTPTGTKPPFSRGPGGKFAKRTPPVTP